MVIDFLAFLVLCVFFGVCTGFKENFVLTSQDRDLTPSTDLEVFKFMRDKIPVVDRFDDIDPKKLLKSGILKVAETDSIIINERVAETIDRLRNYENPVTTDSNKNSVLSFDEYSYANASTFFEKSEWLPLDGCISNRRSNTTSTFSRGWSISNLRGFSLQLELAQIFGITASPGVDLNYRSQFGSAVSCNVDPRKVLQFFLMIDSLTTANIKHRKLLITPRFKSLLKLEAKDWDLVLNYTQINTDTVQHACVTDPEYLNCEEDLFRRN